MIWWWRCYSMLVMMDNYSLLSLGDKNAAFVGCWILIHCTEWPLNLRTTLFSCYSFASTFILWYIVISFLGYDFDCWENVFLNYYSAMLMISMIRQMIKTYVFDMDIFCKVWEFFIQFKIIIWTSYFYLTRMWNYLILILRSSCGSRWLSW